MDRETKLLASDGGANDRFGESVNIDGNYAIVGAHAYDGPNADGNSVKKVIWELHMYMNVM